MNMRYLPRMREGEIKFFMVGEEPLYALVRVPIGEGISVNSWSCKASFDHPSKWPQLVKIIKDSFEVFKKTAEQEELPLLWTADYLLDYN